LGTNLTENLLGASLGIQKEKCLFLDKNDRYGGTLSNYNLENYLDWINAQIESKDA